MQAYGRNGSDGLPARSRCGADRHAEEQLVHKAISRGGSGLGIAVVAIGLVFVAGMRAKSRPVLDTVRKLGRATRPLALKSAGTSGSSTSVIHHVGRTSGRRYETPVVAVPIDDGYVVALPYGPNTDWLMNVLASGSARVAHDGGSSASTNPRSSRSRP